MSEAVDYRHICGYPLKEGSELTRCPGCGGRITPWTVKAATGRFPPEGDAGGELQVLVRWLADEHPELAASLAGLLEDVVTSGTGRLSAPTQAERDALEVAYNALQTARTGS